MSRRACQATTGDLSYCSVHGVPSHILEDLMADSNVSWHALLSLIELDLRMQSMAGGAPLRAVLSPAYTTIHTVECRAWLDL